MSYPTRRDIEMQCIEIADMPGRINVFCCSQHSTANEHNHKQGTISCAVFYLFHYWYPAKQRKQEKRLRTDNTNGECGLQKHDWGHKRQCPEPGMPKKVVAIPATTVFTAAGVKMPRRSSATKYAHIKLICITTFMLPSNNCPQACTKTSRKNKNLKKLKLSSYLYRLHISRRNITIHRLQISRGTTTIGKREQKHI